MLGSNKVIAIARNLKNFKKLAKAGLKFVSSDEEIKAGEKARVESVGGAVLHVRKLNKEESGC